MAEILLSLTIIGVVAAITLPSLMANINERTWNTQRKALYARMSQAIAMMPQLNGYGKIVEDEDGSITEDTVAEAFLTEGLSKVLKINNICDSEHLQDCGIAETFTDMAGNSLTVPKTLMELNDGFSFSYYDISPVKNTNAAAFETQNGESIVAYYNPYCQDELRVIGKDSSGHPVFLPQLTMCSNFIYDLNGNKGPNIVGKDIGFMTAFNSFDPIVVAPMPHTTTLSGTFDFYRALSSCKTISDDMRLPSGDELAAMFINKNLGVFTSGMQFYWSSSVVGVEYAKLLSLNTNTIYGTNKSETGHVRCVKR